MIDVSYHDTNMFISLLDTHCDLLKSFYKLSLYMWDWPTPVILHMKNEKNKYHWHEWKNHIGVIPIHTSTLSNRWYIIITHIYDRYVWDMRWVRMTCPAVMFFSFCYRVLLTCFSPRLVRLFWLVSWTVSCV